MNNTLKDRETGPKPNHPAPPDRITLPSFQSPLYPPSTRPDKEVERIAVVTASEVQNNSGAEEITTSYSLIGSEQEPELDINEFITSSFKLHRHLHKGLTRMNPAEKTEVCHLLRQILKYLENK